MIAGSRQGLGRALAEHYAVRGHSVFGLSRGDSDLVHPRYQHIRTDVTQEDSVQEAFAQIQTSASSLDVLIFCAGLKTSNYALLTTVSQAADMLHTNLLGPFVVTRHAVRLMKRNRFGRLIYLSSIAVPLGSVGSVLGEKALAETRAMLVKPEMLQLDEVAGAIDFFASDAARQITGQTLYFGGVR